ncbi:hypothetical protein ES703_50261 [subsurface metagenome]
MDNEKFKLVSRRGLAWGIGGLFALTVAFVAIWGVIFALDAYVTMAVGIAGTGIGSIIGFYFGKKTSEE